MTKNLVGHELLRKKLREKIGKLQKHLRPFPHDAVHLHIALERHPRKLLHTAKLTLRMPSNILHSKKSGPDLIKSFDLAIKALLRELEGLKTNLRHESDWKRKERRKSLRHEIKGLGFADLPQAEGHGPQEQGEVVADFLRHHYKSLVRHARRHVRHLELNGEAPINTVDPREVVDEVVRQVMNGWREKPANSDWLVWFYQLIRAEMRSQGRTHNKSSSRSLEEIEPLPGSAQLAEGYSPEQPLEIIANELEPFVAELRELVPDPASVPPDEAVARKEILELLQSRIQSWPRPERDVFELHFVEGFEVGDVATITKLSPVEVRESVARLHQRLRGFLLEDA